MIKLTNALNDGNVKAFLWMIRVGEGTANDNGYRTLVGGKLFSSFEDHPRQLITIKLRGGSALQSTAAGAYQFLSRTWDGLVKQYGFKDFSPENQDLGAIALIIGRKALEDVLNGRIEVAIRKCNKEWASLPESPYGQPTKTMDQALETYRLTGGYFRPQGTLAPVETRNVPVLPFIAAVLPSLISAAPDLIRAFGGEGKITERNAKAAEIVVNAAKVATGSVNEQELMEKIESKDPVVMEQIQQAVKEVWFEISSDNSGIQAAREANTKSEGFWKQPAFWITLILVPLVYIVVLAVLGVFGTTVFSTEIQIMVVSSIISGLLGAITGFWLGTSWSSARKTELANK